jgi:hypothetical protein
LSGGEGVCLRTLRSTHLPGANGRVAGEAGGARRARSRDGPRNPDDVLQESGDWVRNPAKPGFFVSGGDGAIFEPSVRPICRWAIRTGTEASSRRGSGGVPHASLPTTAMLFSAPQPQRGPP